MRSVAKRGLGETNVAMPGLAALDDRGILNVRPVRSAVHDPPDRDGETGDHHPEMGDRDAAKRVITMP